MIVTSGMSQANFDRVTLPGRVRGHSFEAFPKSGRFLTDVSK